MSMNRISLPSARWDALRTVRVAGYLGATESMVRDVLVVQYPGVEKDCIRNILHYLEDRKLLRIERSETEPWRAFIARYGYDVCDYQVECDPGIRRPPAG